MFQTLINIFAVFGLGCFIAGAAVMSIVLWAYLELAKEDKAERKDVLRHRDEWHAYMESNYKHLL